MGSFIKGRCPVCGWQISPSVWRRVVADNKVLGLLFHCAGKSGISAASPLSSPEEVGGYDKGLFPVMVGRLLAAVENWVRWDWLKLKDVLSALPIHYLGAGIWVQNFEKEGKRPKERAASDYAMADGGSRLLYRRDIKPVIERGSKDYVW